MKKHTWGIRQKQNMTGWVFLTPAVILLIVMNFVPIFQAFLLSFQSGRGAQMSFNGIDNYLRMFKDSIFKQSIANTTLYMIVTVPLMIIIGVLLAVLLNDPELKLKGLYRTCIFLPAALSIVATSVIFRSLFATDGFVNFVLVKIGILERSYNFLGHPGSARVVLIIMRVWRWVGYQMLFFLAALQNIDSSVYEAARIDGATPIKIFRYITLPLLKPMMVFTLIMCLNTAIQVYDESVNLTSGGPGYATIAMAHYIYNVSFANVPNFGYSCAMSMLILLVVGVLTFIQMKVGDKRE